MIKNLRIKEDFGSVTQSCMTLLDPMDCSTPDFPVLHCLREYARIMFVESVMLSNWSLGNIRKMKVFPQR